MNEEWSSEDPLWRVMGEARQPEPPAWFAAKVVREARRRAQAPWWAGWAAEPRTVAFAVAVTLVAPVALVASLQSAGWISSPDGRADPRAVQVEEMVPEDEVFAAFEALEADYEEGGLWLADAD